MSSTPDDGQAEHPTSEHPTSEQPTYGQPTSPRPSWESGQQFGTQPYGGASSPAYHYAVPDHPKATTSLVLGILGLAVCGVLAPFAWVSGKRAVNEIDASHGRLGGRGQAQAGYVMGIIGSVILALGVLVFLAYIIFFAVFLGGSFLAYD